MTPSGSDSLPSDPGLRSSTDVTPPSATESEIVYYEGSPKVRGSLTLLLTTGLIGIALIAAPFLIGYLGDRWLPWWGTLASVVAGLLFLTVPILFSKTVRYRISNFRIDYERGVLGKTIDTLELWHVDDIRFHQSFTERLLGVGTITVFSEDSTTPQLPLRGVPNPRIVFDALKARVISIKRSRGVVKMDMGHS